MKANPQMHHLPVGSNLCRQCHMPTEHKLKDGLCKACHASRSCIGNLPTMEGMHTISSERAARIVDRQYNGW